MLHIPHPAQRFVLPTLLQLEEQGRLAVQLRSEREERQALARDLRDAREAAEAAQQRIALLESRERRMQVGGKQAGRLHLAGPCELDAQGCVQKLAAWGWAGSAAISTPPCAASV